MKEIEHDLESYKPQMLYSFENTLMAEKYIDYIIEYSENKNSFLELGIGYGETIKLLEKQFKHLTVIDAEPKLISKYITKYKTIDFIQSYFENYTSKKQYYNIGMGFILDIVEDPIELLNHYTDMLEEGGKIYISIGNAASLHRLIAYNAGLIDDIHLLSEQNLKYGHQLFYTFQEWYNLFEKTNLKVIATHGLYLKPLSTLQLLSLELDEKIYKSLSEIAKDLPTISNACFFVLEKQCK